MANALARKLYEEAIALDPENAIAYVALGATHWMEVWVGTSKSPKESLRLAIELGQRTLALDESETGAYAALGHFYALAEQFDRAVAHAERGWPSIQIHIYAFTMRPLPSPIQAGQRRRFRYFTRRNV